MKPTLLVVTLFQDYLQNKSPRVSGTSPTIKYFLFLLEFFKNGFMKCLVEPDAILYVNLLPQNTRLEKKGWALSNITLQTFCL